MVFTRSHRSQPCDLCGQADFELVAERDRRGQPLATVLCRQCGLISHEQIPDEAELAAYYADTYRQDYHGEHRPSAHRFLREWRRTRRLVRALAPYLREHDRVLDIGCGMGCTVKQFQLAGYDATGLEPGSGFGGFARHVLQARVQAGSLADLPAVPTYQFVLLNHVLEHFRSPLAALAHIHALLPQGGRLYVEVPNAEVPYSAPEKIFHYAHIYNFTTDTLRRLAERSGFHLLAWLQTAEDRNLRAVFTAAEPRSWRPLPGSYARARAALERHSFWSYYARGRYWRDRLSTVVMHSSQRLLARHRCDRVLAVCRQDRNGGVEVENEA